MPEITVHFTAESGANADALAEQVREQVTAATPAVETAQAEVVRTRSIDPALAMSTIVAVIHYTPMVIDGVSKIIESLTKIAKDSQAFHSVIVEICGK